MLWKIFFEKPFFDLKVRFPPGLFFLFSFQTQGLDPSHLTTLCATITRDCSEKRNNTNTSGSFREIWYLLYNAQIFWVCEIAGAWHCSLRSKGWVSGGGGGGVTEKSAWSAQAWQSASSVCLSMQVCFSKQHQRDAADRPLCDPRCTAHKEATNWLWIN